MLIMRLSFLLLASFGLAADLPTSVRVEPAKLTFHVATIARGTLAEQVHAQVKHLEKDGQLVKLRAFTTGSSENVKQTIRHSLHGKALPVVDVIQVGALAGGAEVILESVASSKNVVNPSGLLFVSGQASTAPLEGGKADAPVLPLAQKSLANLKTVLSSNGAGEVLRIACFTSSLADESTVHGLMVEAFPKATVSVVQVQSVPTNQEVECEAIARLVNKPTEPIQLVNPTKAAFAQAVLVSAPVIVLTSTEWNADARATFTQLKAALEAGGSSLDHVFYSYAYPSSAAMLQKYRDVRWDFLVRDKAPASTNLVFAGTATGERVGIDVMALPKP
jgi:enamine deaminase RidA (YjgF/YER057c/UK114 family)